MKKYSKAIAAIVGAITSTLIVRGLISAEWQTPEVQAAIVTIGTAAIVYLAPANRKT